MKSCMSLILLLLALLPAVVCGQEQQSELRGVWITPRAGGRLWSENEITQAIENAASHNFNAVYFNVWSRGWPLWRSQEFYAESGFYSDPLAGERDLLEEAVRAAQKHGLHVEAWFEYGFVAWWSGNNMATFPKGPLCARHPEWLAKDNQGSDQFPSGHVGVFYWLSHNHPGARQMLIRLSQEIAQKYAVNGIELDRIRYPGLNCGYDECSRKLYQQDTGNLPPQDPSEAGWKRWRADRLIAFQSEAYDAIKKINPALVVSNAPSHYTSGDGYPAYDNFLQDWRAWLNIGKLDMAQVQMYVKPEDLALYIPSALRGVQTHARGKVFAGISAKTSSYTLSAEQTVELIHTVRKAGLRGCSFWYYNDLHELGYFPYIRSLAYATPVPVPHR